MDWKKGILTVVITASLAVCPFSAAFAEWDDANTYIQTDMYTEIVAITGRIDLLRADVSDMLQSLNSIKNNDFWHNSSADGTLGYFSDGDTKKTLGAWLSNIYNRVADTASGKYWYESSANSTLGYFSDGDTKKTLGAWLSNIYNRSADIKSELQSQSFWHDNSSNNYLGYASYSDTKKTLGAWLSNIYNRVAESANQTWLHSNNASNYLGYSSYDNTHKSLGAWLSNIYNRSADIKEILNNWSSSQNPWTANDIDTLLNGVEAINSSNSALSSELDGGGLYFLNVIADELHKTDPGYLKEWLIDIYDAIGTQTSQLQEAIEGINAGGSSGGSSADLSTIEGLLSKLTYYSDGATGYILKVHDLGVFDQLTDVNTELIGIRTLLGQFFAADTASDVIGEVDFSEIADKSNATLDTVSTLAPFGSILLYSECVAILSTTPAVQEPKLVFDFNFCPGVNEHVTLDLSWLDPMHDAINFACMLMLVMGLASITMRYVELEAAS